MLGISFLPHEVSPASRSGLVLCPRDPEQHSNLDVPPKLFVMVFVKDLDVVPFFSVIFRSKIFCGLITQVNSGATVLISVGVPGSRPGQRWGRAWICE